MRNNKIIIFNGANIIRFDVKWKEMLQLLNKRDKNDSNWPIYINRHKVKFT